MPPGPEPGARACFLCQLRGFVVSFVFLEELAFKEQFKMGLFWQAQDGVVGSDVGREEWGRSWPGWVRVLWRAPLHIAFSCGVMRGGGDKRPGVRKLTSS